MMKPLVLLAFLVSAGVLIIPNLFGFVSRVCGRFAMKKFPKTDKWAVKAQGEYVLDYVESFRGRRPCWFVGAGRVAGNTTPIPSGLHSTPRQAWHAAAVALGVAQ